MRDHHPEISQERIFYFERQLVVVNDFEALGYILDIGGGGEGIIGRLKRAQVVAIDPLRRELEEAPEGPLKIVMDGTDLQFLDGAFGTVTAFFTFMYIKEDAHSKLFEEAFRVLAPGGRFLVWDAAFPPRVDEEKDIAVVPLTVRLPGEEVSTGYGVWWPEGGRGIENYVDLARASGFRVLTQVKKEQSIYLELAKPQV